MFFPKSHILHLKNVVSKRECDNIIYYFESNTDIHSKGFTLNGFSDEEKKDTEIFCDFSKSNMSWIKEHLYIAIEKYKKTYPMVNKLSSWDLCPHYKIQRYNPSEGYFLLHCENPGIISKEPEMGKRVLAWMIYLNDVRNGGHTYFPEQKKKFQPRVGDILIWPAYFTHPHRGIVSKTETKYIISGWVSFNENH